MWDRFIDLVTVFWLGLFVTEFIAPLGQASEIILLSLIPVYVADLVVKYRRVRNLRRFVKEQWLTILMVIPYFRVLRLIRLFRLVRILRVARAGRALKFEEARQNLRREW